jgi:hypothetical protein
MDLFDRVRRQRVYPRLRQTLEKPVLMRSRPAVQVDANDGEDEDEPQRDYRLDASFWQSQSLVPVYQVEPPEDGDQGCEHRQQADHANQYDHGEGELRREGPALVQQDNGPYDDPCGYSRKNDERQQKNNPLCERKSCWSAFC